MACGWLLAACPAPKAKDADEPGAKFEAEYGNALSSFLEDFMIASVAVASVGRGIKDRTVGFSDG